MEEFIQDGNEYLPLRDVVLTTLRREILTGVILPGEHLLEIPISQRLGVSRTPVREAMRALEQEGLVIMIPRHGARVSRITEKSMRDVLEVREALDALCVELACSRITEEGKVELRKTCEAFEKAVLTNDSRKIAHADVAFHDVIIKYAGNVRLNEMEENLSQTMYRYRYEYINVGKGHENLVREHREIYENIVSGNAEAAAKAARLHIENQRRMILERIREEEENGDVNHIRKKRKYTRRTEKANG